MCRSRGGNPPAQLIWYKNGVQVRMAYRFVEYIVILYLKVLIIVLYIILFPVYRTAGRVSENNFSFKAEASDNKARFRCEASNIMSQTPLKAEIDLSVLCTIILRLTYIIFNLY